MGKFVLLLEDNGSLIPISYGDSDTECAFWLANHIDHYRNDTVYVAELTLLQSPEDE